MNNNQPELNNYPAKKLLTEIEKRLANNSCTTEEIKMFLAILIEHYPKFNPVFLTDIKQARAENQVLAKQIKDNDEKLSQIEQEQVDQFWAKYGFAKKDEA